ncbi:MAG: acyl-CoA thioesterase [Ruminococcus sp.]|nr:acyl-CoA thioesterase [Ruminococcus sp.]
MQLRPYRRRAYYYETDRMDIIHHSNYVRWLEETRVDALEQVGCPFAEIEKRGLYSPVLAVETNYKYPIKFGDEFEVRAKLTEFNGCKYAFEYEIVNITTGQAACIAKTKHCFTDTELRPVRMKKKHPDIYEKFLQMVGIDYEEQ